MIYSPPPPLDHLPHHLTSGIRAPVSWCFISTSNAMAFEPKGVYNRAHVFNGENYGYWKDCMRVHINSIDRNVWTAIQNGPFQITMRNDVSEIVPKPEDQYEIDEKKWSCDWRGRNMIISALGVDECDRWIWN